MTGPTLVFLHALGASAGEWKQVLDHLPNHACVALDLPGFGAAAEAGHANVGAMADWLADEIRSRTLTSYVLVGHSMGGKIVTLVAARAAAGEIGLSRVLGVVLVAASPPSPEPMDEERRDEMIGWFVNGEIAGADAATFVDANTATTLAEPLRDAAIDDVRGSSREAWPGWLERGSREDWSAEAGRIAIPALILAGAEDGDLGEDAQCRLNLPHYVTAEVQVVRGAAHLIPYEHATLTMAAGGFAALHSDAQTRLLERVDGGEVGSADDTAQLSPEQMVLWFEDVRAETVRVWMSLPATMAAIGYDGFAVGGDGRRKQGYIRTGADDPEAWQQARERLS